MSRRRHRRRVRRSSCINEVDYDQVGADHDEFVEIYNAGDAAADLTGIARLARQRRRRHRVQPQAAHRHAGGRRRTSSSTSRCRTDAPDGVALVNLTTKTLIDALSYEGAITAATIDGTTYNLVEGIVIDTLADSNTVEGSLSRIPNGTDTNNTATDWVFTTTVTRGAANVATS